MSNATDGEDGAWSEGWSDIGELESLIGDGESPPASPEPRRASPKRKRDPAGKKKKPASQKKPRTDAGGSQTKKALEVPSESTAARQPSPKPSPAKAAKKKRPSRKLKFDSDGPLYVTVGQFVKTPETAKRRPATVLHVPAETITLAETMQTLEAGLPSKEAALSLLSRLCIVSIGKTLTWATQEAAKTDAAPAMYAAYTTAKDAEGLMRALYKACTGDRWSGECSADGLALSSGTSGAGTYTPFETMALATQKENGKTLVWPHCMTYKMTPSLLEGPSASVAAAGKSASSDGGPAAFRSKSPMRAFQGDSEKHTAAKKSPATAPQPGPIAVPEVKVEPSDFSTVTVPIGPKSVTVTITFN